MGHNRLKFLWLLLVAGCIPLPGAPGFILPDNVRPKRYQIDLTVRPEEPGFEGTVRIDLDFREPASSFWLNARNLRIEEARLFWTDSDVPLRIVYGDAETTGFESTATIPRGPAQVLIRYRGVLDKDSNDGVFRRLLGGDWYVFTTFTPIEARRAFPCFDEPRFKTPWQLTLHVKQDETALSNTPSESETVEPGGMKKLVFAATPPLPSEVVAFAVGPFDVVDAGRAGSKQVPVRIITPHGRAGDAEAARIATPEILDRLEEYTGIPYPWAKLDHLALVKGAFGAVENPGLITYQEGILLASPERDTAERRHQMRSTMAHELAHQWFGNLVTQASWTDVWLSEGFATWLSTKIMAVEYPPYERGLADNLRLRAMSTERRGWAVRRTIASREDAKTVYNGLVYQKAAAVLDTIEDWLGDTPMRQGLHHYLAEHSFGTASTDDVAAALHSESGKDVTPVLHSFLDRPGVPEVSATRECNRLNVTAGVWTVPLCLHWTDGGHECTVVGPGQKEVAVPANACPAWIWTNGTGRGYYRSRLTAADLNAIGEHGYAQLDSSERRSLTSDAGFAMLHGQIPAATLMRLLATFARDPEPGVLLESLRVAASLGDVVGPADRALYQRWMQQNFGITAPDRTQAASIGEFLKQWAAEKPGPRP